MADKKMSTIILEVDLDCSRCVKKINKTLKKYPEIQTQILNHEKKTVTISGPFDPEKLVKCICCRAGKYIKSYEIVKPKPKPPKPEAPKPDPPKPAAPKPDPKPEPPKPEAPKPDAQKPKPETPKPEPPVIPAQPYPVPVCCGPCYEGRGGGPCWHGWAPQPCPPWTWGRPCYEGYGAGPCSYLYAPPSGCRFFSEEESTCRTM